MNTPPGIGVIGCGNISSVYLENLKSFRKVRLVACADLITERARAQAEAFGIPQAITPEALLSHSDVDVVLNLTTPEAHAAVGLAALEAGKHLYNEKPLAAGLDDARKILAEAKSRKLQVGCAPDTFLGSGLATCRKLIDDGLIGDPVAGCAFFTSPGHESWHPDPTFYYKPGGGPLLDMGPYYLTALVALLGPVERVTGCTRKSFPTRTITSQPRHGDKIQVDVATHETALLEFAGGPVVSVIMSFDVQATHLPMLEIYGSRGSLAPGDPNTFGGPIEVYQRSAGAWRSHDLLPGYSHNSRGIGVAEMAEALAEGRPHRASGDMALHVLEVMHSIHQAAASNRHMLLLTACNRPDPLPEGWSA